MLRTVTISTKFISHFSNGTFQYRPSSLTSQCTHMSSGPVNAKLGHIWFLHKVPGVQKHLIHLTVLCLTSFFSLK